jgi:Ca-activated chloride channel family protein
MGVGTENGGPIPIKNDSGSLSEYKKDKNGEVVITKLNTEILENIAKSTNGGYIAGNNTKEALDRLKNAMDNIEKTEFETEQIAEYQTQYQWFLAFAFLLILADVFFFEKKTAWVQKLNLFNKK